MVDRSELEARGWIKVPGVARQDELFQIARSLGRPVISPTGELIKLLVPKDVTNARPSTLSAAHGTGAFPLHTDTAFWPTPCRYLVFRATGDVRRITVLASFAPVLRSFGNGFYKLAERSVWIARTQTHSHYCSMIFRVGRQTGCRYDPQCMVPANEAAKQVDMRLRNATTELETETLRWEEGLAIIVCNWKMLHGRGPMPIEEKKRVLERIYVE